MIGPKSLRLTLTVATLVGAGLVLGACGRKGALDPPPGAFVETAPAAPTVVKQGAPPPPKGKVDPGPVPPQKSIPLDRLL